MWQSLFHSRRAVALSLPEFDFNVMGLTGTIRVLCLLLCLTIAAWAQNVPAYSSQRVQRLAEAIAWTEGFTQKGSLPARYHNPGDLKALSGTRFPGQVGVGKGQHAIFKNDTAGWAALHRQLYLIVAGRSKHFRLDMTLTQVGRQYAQNSKVWAQRVSKYLGVSPQTTLYHYLTFGGTYGAIATVE